MTEVSALRQEGNLALRHGIIFFLARTVHALLITRVPSKLPWAGLSKVPDAEILVSIWHVVISLNIADS